MNVEDKASKELAKRLFQEVERNRSIVSEIHNLLTDLKKSDLLYNKIESDHFINADSYSVVFMRQLASDVKEGKIFLNK